MPRYNPQTLIDRIESLANGDGVDLSDEPSSVAAIDNGLPATWEVFQNSIIPRLGQHNAVNRLEPGNTGGLVGLAKKVIKKVVIVASSPFLNRQAAFNAGVMNAFDLMSNHLDLMQKRMVETQEYHEKKINGLDGWLHQAQIDIDKLSDGYKQQSAQFEQLNQNIENLKSQLSEKEKKYQELLTQETASLRTSYEGLYQETKANFESVTKGIKDLESDSTKRIDEFRDTYFKRQHEINFNFQNQNDDHQELEKKVERCARKNDIEWIPDGYRSMENRMGTVEADLRRLDSKSIEIQGFRSLLNETLEKLKKRSKATPSPSTSDGASTSEQVDPVKQLRTRDQDLAYYRFQREFRGDEKILRKRQTFYVNLLREKVQTKQADQISCLDLACGDGVFVSLLQEAGIQTTGVDMNGIMVEQARSQNLDVRESDVFSFLDQAEASQYNLITTIQFVEHLKPAMLERLLTEVHRVLKPGGVFLVETLNPHTLMAHNWFHFDLTHEKLIFPEMMKLRMLMAGFEFVESRTINPVEDHHRLQNGDGDANIDRLNEFLYGDQDYYMLGRKPIIND